MALAHNAVFCYWSGLAGASRDDAWPARPVHSHQDGIFPGAQLHTARISGMWPPLLFSKDKVRMYEKF
jgi:hypothetical protein